MTGSRTIHAQIKRRRRKRKRQKALFSLGVFIALAVVVGLAFYWRSLAGSPETEAADVSGPFPSSSPSASPGVSKSGDLPTSSPIYPNEDTNAGKPGSSDAGQPPDANDQRSSGVNSMQLTEVRPSEPPKTAASRPADETAQAGAESRVKMAFVGDVMLGSTVETILKRNGFDYPYKEVLTQLQQPDLTIANFESPVTERGTEQQKDYVYRTSPKALPAFVEAGFDLVNLANNHVMDYGETGLLDTFDFLDRAGIKRVGAGRDADEAYAPVIMEKNGIKIAFLGFSRVVPDVSWKAGKKHPGVAETYDDTAPLKAIEAAKKQADLVVVLAHWGLERTDKPVDHQVRLAHRYIDAGADLIVGGHPHVLQGMEFYKGKWIAYSLGNFIFTTNNVAATLETMILEASCSKQGECELKATPVFTKDAKPEVMAADKAKNLLARLSKISFHAKVEADGTIKRE